MLFPLTAFFLFLFSLSAQSLQNQGSFINLIQEENLRPFTLKVQPHLSIPFDTPSEQGNSIFGIGGGANVTGEFLLPSLPQIGFALRGGYTLNPIKNSDSGLMVSTISAAALFDGNLNFSPKLELDVFAGGGYYVSFLHNYDASDLWSSISDQGLVAEDSNWQMNPYITAGASFLFRPAPSLLLGVGASYENYWNFYQGISINLNLTIQPGRKLSPENREQIEGDQLEIERLDLDDLFPVFYKYYDNHPIGGISVINKSRQFIKDAALTFFAPQYMDIPVKIGLSDGLEEGESAQSNFHVLFNDSILTITEATKTPVQIKLTWNSEGQSYYRDYGETLRLYDRNAIIWDDDQRAAAFITAKDLAVIGFSKILASMVSGMERDVLNTPFATAMAVHEALRIYDINYVIDPQTPYAEFSGQQMKIDYLQFPRYTLLHKAGDCDDLSILYTSLLEAVGVETAFITIPGHIFIAFSTGFDRDRAVELFGGESGLILNDGMAWIPLEITLTNENFLYAWDRGARQWRENSAAGQAGFFPVHKAWETYEPVGLPTDPPEIPFPDRNKVTEAFEESLDQFIHQRISRDEQDLLKQLANRDNPAERNKLAVLYARFGLLEEAEEQLLRAQALRRTPSVMANLGNLYFLRKDYREAYKWYEEFYKEKENSFTALLNFAKVNYELENYGTVKDLYRKMEDIDTGRAEKYSYLILAAGDETARAGDQSEQRNMMIWEED